MYSRLAFGFCEGCFSCIIPCGSNVKEKPMKLLHVNLTDSLFKLNTYGIWQISSRILDDDLYDHYMADHEALIEGLGESSDDMSVSDRTILMGAIIESIMEYPYQIEHLDAALQDGQCLAGKLQRNCCV